MPYNIKQLGEKSVSIDFFIADPTYIRLMCSNGLATGVPTDTPENESLQGNFRCFAVWLANTPGTIKRK